jgi:glutamate-ammonia-ligase adenylyltransferase
LPKAADPGRAAVGLERWAERAAASGDAVLAAEAVRLAADPEARRVLESLFGNSPYLTHCLLADLGFAIGLLERGVDAAYGACLAMLSDTDARRHAHPGSTDEIMARLRVAKRRASLAIALADIADLWPLERITAALSEFASAAVRVAVRHLLRQAAAQGWLQLPDGADPERGSGFIVLGLGKLGAHELNYSSDIDLVVLYDDERLTSAEPDRLNERFVRLTRELVRILQERTPDGYVFRTDLRLRPDPGATPIAISTRAAELYYESLGQNWERAAFIKARILAGDNEAGEAFLASLRPFIWRKHLDFAAIQDIHSIKRQIYAHRGGGRIAVAGHNVKLGRGGIREIEFFAQTQQLIWGGREPALRVRSTYAALDALVAGGHIEAEVADQLRASYAFLRKVEHRLQMINDEQTHELPTKPDALAALAIFLGYGGADAFGAALVAQLRCVEEHYARLFEEAPDLGAARGNLVFTGGEHDPGTLETIAKLGFKEPERASAMVRGWHHGRYRAMRSTRARELLTELTPTLLGELAKAVDPDTALLSFDAFLGRLPAGVQLFSLFYANPTLLGLVAEIMGSAPRLADQLAQHPLLLDAVLTSDFFRPPPDHTRLADSLAEALGQANDFQDILDIVRRWCNDRRFQVGVQMLRGSLDPEAAGPVLADIADCAVASLIEPVIDELAETHGRMPKGEFAVLALGKMGGREMTITSDLDLLFVYRVADGIEASDGRRPLAPSQYYARLSQRLLSAITVQTGEGRLYEVDMRLRPSGEQGPVATSLEGFLDYQRRSAWTWEHMALTRARVSAAARDFADVIEAGLRSVLTAARDPDNLLLDVAEMRQRIERSFPTQDIWEGKRVRGGLVDLEFIAQYFELRHAHTDPEVLSPNTTDAFERLKTAGALEARTADELVAATHLWRRVQGITRLAAEREFNEETAPDGLRRAIAHAAGAVDFDALKVKLKANAAMVKRRFASLIETPAQKLPRGAPDPETQSARVK